MLRRITALTLLVFVSTAFSCIDITGTRGPKFADVAGTYDYNAPINQIPGAYWQGSLTITQPSRDAPNFSGSFNISLIGPDGRNYGGGGGSIVNGQLSESGTLTFDFDDSDFSHTGNLAGTSVSGTWILRDTEGNFTGSFTANRR